MNLYDLEPAWDHDVYEWLENSIELTDYQKDRIRGDEIVRFSNLEFFKRRDKVNNIWIRLSIVFVLPVWILLSVGVPFNFIITGRWGYNHKKMQWYSKWMNAIGIR